MYRGTGYGFQGLESWIPVFIVRFSYDLEMKTRKRNRDNKQTEMERFDWFIEWIKRAWLWLVKRTLRRKNVMPENILEIALTSYCNTISQLIEQCLLQIRGFLWRENEESMFWSFHPLADKTNNEQLSKPFFHVIRKSLHDLHRISFCNGRL